MDLELKLVNLETGEEVPLDHHEIVSDQEGVSRWDDDKKAVEKMQNRLKTLPQDFAIRLAQENRPLTIKEFCMVCLTTNSVIKLKLLDFFLSLVPVWPKDETPLGTGESILMVHRNKEVAVCQEIEKAFVAYQWQIERRGQQKIYTTRHKLSFDICDAVRDVRVTVLGLPAGKKVSVIGIEKQYMGMTVEHDEKWDEDNFIAYTIEHPAKKLLSLKPVGDDTYEGHFPGIMWLHYPWRGVMHLELAIESDRIPHNIEVYFTYKNYVLDNLCREAITDMAQKIEIKPGGETCELIFKSGGEIKKIEPMMMNQL